MAIKRLLTLRTRPPWYHSYPRPLPFTARGSSQRVQDEILHTTSLSRSIVPTRRLTPLSTVPLQLHVVRSSLVESLRSLFLGASVALTLVFGYIYITDTRASIHTFAPRVLQLLYEDAEDAHEVGNAWLRGLYTIGLHPRERDTVPEDQIDLTVKVSLIALRRLHIYVIRGRALLAEDR